MRISINPVLFSHGRGGLEGVRPSSPPRASNSCGSSAFRPPSCPRPAEVGRFRSGIVSAHSGGGLEGIRPSSSHDHGFLSRRRPEFDGLLMISAVSGLFSGVVPFSGGKSNRPPLRLPKRWNIHRDTLCVGGKNQFPCYNKQRAEPFTKGSDPS